MKRLAVLFIVLALGTLALTAPSVRAQESSITICKDTDPDGSIEEFQFSGDLGDFTLSHGECEDFEGLEAGEYSITEDEGDSHDLESIKCLGGAEGKVLVRGPEEVVITLGEDEHIECLFDNNALFTPTPAPTATPTRTPTPTATATVGPGTPTPQIVFVPVPIEVTRVVTQTITIRPPSTGDGGIR